MLHVVSYNETNASRGTHTERQASAAAAAANTSQW